METSLVTRNIRIGARRTSVRLEPELWTALEELAARESLTINQICARVQSIRGPNGGFTSAMRVFIITYYKIQLSRAERECQRFSTSQALSA